MSIYKHYDQAALDRQYNNRLQTPDFAVYLERCELSSRRAEKEHRVIKDIAYGKLQREELDIYPSSLPGSKTLVFIHGGYWHKMDKKDFQFIGGAFAAKHVTTVLITYPLAPVVSIDQIVSSCREAIRWVYNNISSFNGNPDELYVAGHSAGGHLTAMLLTTNWKELGIPQDTIKGACALSGLFNLVPVELADVNAMVKMDKETAVRNSPSQLEPQSTCPMLIAVGADESQEFIDQSTELYESWQGKLPVELMELKEINHYSIVESIAEEGSLLNMKMLKMMKAFNIV